MFFKKMRIMNDKIKDVKDKIPNITNLSLNTTLNANITKAKDNT